MKKHILLYLIITICNISIWANQISEVEARIIAYTFAQDSPTHRRAPDTTPSTIATAHIARDNNGNNLLYVFNRSDKGYIVVAADDMVCNPILGYSDEGTFEYDKIPPGMHSWLSMYKQEIEHARQMPQDTNTYIYQSLFDKDVAPLVEARWGQDEPYNLLCPTDKTNRAPTGCVATAMAQVMYHHKWPNQGSGKIEVYNGANSEVIDFANTTYEWDNMTPMYSSLSTEAECNAVATLMYHVGRSVNMMYGDASGAVTAEAARALATYWKYDKAIIHRDRKYYTIEEWERMIMEEIDNNRPILYHGQSPEGGHAFVLDGYNSDGYVHINWGWNGMSNGYFMLHALSPEKQGTGGFNGGYNTGQGAIFGIQPNQGNKSTIEITAQSFTIPDGMSYKTGEMISTVVTGIANAGWNNASFGMGYMLYDSNDNLVTSIHSCNLTISGSSSLGSRNIMLTLPDSLSDGTYHVYPAHTDANGNWKHVAMSMNELPYQTIEINAGKVTVLSNDEGSLWATQVVCNDPAIYSNRYTSFAVTMSNTTAKEYQGALFVSIYERTGQFEQRRSNPIAISIPTGKEVHIDIPMQIAVSKGSYKVFITNENKEKLSDAMEISVLEEPENAELKVTEFTLNCTAQDYLQVSYTVTNNGHDYTGTFRPWIQFTNLQYTSSYDNSATTSIPRGESVDLSHTWRFDDGVVGEKYICTLWCEDLRKGGMKQLTNETIMFTLSEPTGVISPLTHSTTIYPNPASHHITINSDEAIKHVAIYNAQGQLVIYTTNRTIDVSTLSAGIYYIVTNKETTNKLLIK